MVQEWRPIRVQEELLQVYGAGKEGERGRGHHVGVVQGKILNDIDSEGPEDRKGSRNDFRKPLDVWSTTVYEIEVPHLFSVGKKLRYGTDVIRQGGEYIQRGTFRTLEEGFQVDLTPYGVQL